MNRLLPSILIAVGAALILWAAHSSLQPAPAPFEIARAPAVAPREIAELAAPSLKFERLDIRSPESRGPLATGVVLRGADGRPAPLSWRNAVTEPVLFADIAPADEAKVLAAIREHVPEDAAVLSWWDFSRRIRALAERKAPLDDGEARGLRIPSAWGAEARDLERVPIEKPPRAFSGHALEALRAAWGAGVALGESATFGKFVEALLSNEAEGSAALGELAGGKEAYLAVNLSDVWKAAAARPEQLEVAYKDFPGGDMHGVMKAAREWMQSEKIGGGFAVEPIGAAVRLHYLPRKADSGRLLARLLPFSTSNPAALDRFALVYQHKGYWIYKLTPAND